MAKREVKDLDLKVKLTNEYLENGGIEKIHSPDLLEDLMKVEIGPDGKVNPDTVSTSVNAFMLGILGSHRMPPVFHPEFISMYASLLQKSNSFEQANIDTVTQFDKIYDKYKIRTDTLFRGQREAKWRLYSQLQRHWISEKLFNKENSYQNIIEKLVEIGNAEFSVQIKELLKSKQIEAINSISVLSFLQHHKCPTPLLDWTYKFQNALYFAIDKIEPNKRTVEIEDYFSVYYIEEKHFESGSLRTMMEEGLSEIEKPMLLKLIAKIAKDDKTKKEMEEHFAGRKLIDRQKLLGTGFINYMTKVESLMKYPVAYFSDKDAASGILFSLNNNKNILNQAGVFTWNADSSKPLEMVGDEQYRVDRTGEEIEYKFCSCFNIHKSLANHVRKRLEEDGITKEFIYPSSEISTQEVFQKAKNIKKTKSAIYKNKKSKVKKRKRTNKQIVDYWIKRNRSKKKRLNRKRSKNN